MEVSGRGDAVNDQVTASLAPASNVECANSRADFVSCSASGVLGALEQVVQRLLDQEPIPPTLCHTPVPAAMMQHVADVSASRRRDDESCHLRSIIGVNITQIGRDLFGIAQDIVAALVDVANTDIDGLS